MRSTDADVNETRTRPHGVWIIVCEDFHGAVGPIPTQRLAADLAVEASEMGGCTYRPVRLALSGDRSGLNPGDRAGAPSGAGVAG